MKRLLALFLTGVMTLGVVGCASTVADVSDASKTVTESAENTGTISETVELADESIEFIDNVLPSNVLEADYDLLEKTADLDVEEPVIEDVITEDVTENTVVLASTSAKTSTKKNTPFGKYGKLHVEGAGLADSKGNTVQLKGVSSHGLQWFPQYINYDAMKTMRDEWGVEVVRLAMYSAEGGYCTGDKANRKKLISKINNAVKWADELGMYVIIDWHVLGEGNPQTYQKQARNFFKRMSKKYKDHDNIFYEVCNEPNGGVTWSQVKSYATKVINTIRKNDKDAICIVGSPTWSQDVDQAAANPIKKKNVCYSLHYYAATHGSWLRDKAEKALNAGIALYVTEYGICDASGNGNIDTKSADEWMKFLDKYGISSCIWSLCNKAESASLIKSSCNKTYGWKESDLAQSGTWFVKMMKGTTKGIGKYEKPVVNTDNNQSGSSEQNKQNNSQSNNNSSNTEAASADIVTNNSGNYSVTVSQASSWGEGPYNAQYNVKIVNNTSSDISGYKVQVTYKDKVSVDSGWCGTITAKDKTITIKPEDYNSTVVAGGTIDNIGFILKSNKEIKVESVDMIH